MGVRLRAGAALGLAKLSEPAARQMNAVKIPDRNFLGHLGVNPADRNLAEKRHRNGSCNGAEACRAGPRKPVLHDPALIFGVDDRQIRIVAEDLVGSMLYEHLEDHLMQEAKLGAGRIFSPDHLDAGEALIIRKSANRIITRIS